MEITHTIKDNSCYCVIGELKPPKGQSLKDILNHLKDMIDKYIINGEERVNGVLPSGVLITYIKTIEDNIESILIYTPNDNKYKENRTKIIREITNYIKSE